MNLFSSSLINKVKILGVLLVFLMLFILFIAFKTSTLHTKKTYVHHAIKISKLLNSKSNLLENYLQNNNLETVTKGLANKLIKKSDDFVSDTLIREVFLRYGIAIYKNGDTVILAIKDHETEIYFKSNNNVLSTIIIPIIISAFLFIIIILGLYYYISSAFFPLIRLEKNIELFSKAQDMDIQYENAHDEIANIANAFYTAIEYNKTLKLHKDMYICMVMHEISTPLTKAKFITHFMNDSDEKEKLNTLFDSMQLELDKVHEFEMISTQVNQLNVAKHSLNLLLEDVCDVLLLDKENIFIQGIKLEKEFDYTLFIVVIRNLVDNAIKYSSNNKADININQEFIEIKNRAIETSVLKIEKLLEPFEQANECSSGMGLGLFLINEIVTKHNFTLTYRFIEGYHSFRVYFVR